MTNTTEYTLAAATTKEIADELAERYDHVLIAFINDEETRPAPCDNPDCDRHNCLFNTERAGKFLHGNGEILTQMMLETLEKINEDCEEDNG